MFGDLPSMELASSAASVALLSELKKKKKHNENQLHWA